MTRTPLLVVLLLVSLAVNGVLGYRFYRQWRVGNRPAIVEVTHQPSPEGDRLVVRFGTPMRLDPPPGPSPLQFTPPVRYLPKWVSPSELHALVDGHLPPGKRYAVQPTAELADAHGGPLPTTPVAIETVPLQLLGVSPPAHLGDRRIQIAFEFNGPLRAEQLLKSLDVTDADGRRIPVRAVAEHPPRSPLIELTDCEEGFAELRLRLRKTVTATDGDRGLAEDWQTVLRPSQELAVGLLSSVVEDEDIFLRVHLSKAVSLVRLQERLSIEPSVPFVVTRDWWGGRYRLKGEFRPRTFYRVDFAAGLYADDGTRLATATSRSVVTANLPPLARFMTRGPILPAAGRGEIPFRVCNTDTLRLSATRVFPNNLPDFLRNQEQVEDYGLPVAQLELDLALEPNSFHHVSIPFAQIVPNWRRGIYVVGLDNSRHWWRREQRTMVVTDIALSGAFADQQAVVWARSLATNAPLPGCQIRVLSPRNQLLGQGTTDAQGRAEIDLETTPEKGETAYLVTASLVDDLGLLLLPASRHGLMEFDTTGRPPAATAYEALLYSERGIYRPGETVTLAAIVRDDRLRAAGSLPARLTVVDPAGARLLAAIVELDASGFATLSVPLPKHARTGSYVAKIGLPQTDGRSPIWGEAQFRVGAYMPDRLRATLQLEAATYTPADTLVAQLAAAYYFGAPGVACKGSFRVSLQDLDFAPKGFAGYTFGDAERPPINDTIHQAELTTDSEGHATLRLPLASQRHQPRQTLQLIVVGSILEAGGRAVSATATAPLHVQPFHLGLQCGWKDPQPPAAGPLPIRWATVAADGTPLPVDQEWRYQLFEKQWQHVLVRSTGGDYHYTWQLRRERIAEGTVAATGEAAGEITLPFLPPGQYELLAGDALGQVQTRLPFWFHAGADQAQPTRSALLRLQTDRPSYPPGAVAKLSFHAPAAGVALLASTAGNRLEQVAETTVAKGLNTIDLPVPATPFGSLYAAVTLIVDPAADGAPADPARPRRLFGLAKLAIDQQEHALTVDLEAPEVAEPGQTITVKLALAQGGQPVAGKIHLFAVDQGILALTAHRTPDPFAFFHGPRACRAAFADIFDQLFPELPSDGGASTVGGDAGNLARLFNPLPIDDFTPAVVVLPLVDLPASGQATVELALPKLTGAMRLMAVAFNAEAVGHAEAAIILRQPVSVLLSGPRAVAPGDTFAITVQLLNHSLPAGEASWRLAAEGPIRLVDGDAQGTLVLTPGGEARHLVRCQADPDQASPAKLTASLALGDKRDEAIWPISIRPPTPAEFRGQFAAVAPGQTLTLAAADWLPGSFSGRLDVSPLPGIEVAPALAWLRAYPYGCLEQTVSAAFPLPYFAALLSPYGSTGAGDLAAATTELNAAIQRIMMMELPAGGFSTWPGGREAWLGGTLYAAHFLLEARDFGATVDDPFWRRTVRFLQRVALGEIAGVALADHAYALYLLARAGQPEPNVATGILAGEANPPFARLLAAASLLGTRDAARGRTELEQLLTQNYLEGQLGWEMDSPGRRTGLAANLLLDLLPEHPEAARLVQELRRQRGSHGHWHTTQGNALAVIALGKYLARQPPDRQSTGHVTLAGQRTPVSLDSPFAADLEQPAPISVEAAGPGPLYLAHAAFGVPRQPTTETIASGLRVEREYLDEEMQPKTTFKQGDLVRVRLTLASPEPRTNVVVADLLPGGLEIEDGSLETRWAPSDKARRMNVLFVDKLDDRLLLFCHLDGGRHPATFVYTARAVTPGTYTIPRLAAECMYSPEIRAATGNLATLHID